MTGETPKVVAFEPSNASAFAEIRRQLEQAYSLVAGARSLLGDVDAEDADRLLDMAEDILAEQEYINRVHPQRHEGESDD